MRESVHSQENRIPTSWWRAAAIGLAAAIALPILGNLSRNDSSARCALDGQVINDLYAVGITTRDDSEFDFCCLICAELWIERSKATPRKITVVDETSGEPFAASDAYYIDGSTVFSNAPTGDRRHVFRKLADANSHVATFRGRLLTGNERPFQFTSRQKPSK